MGEGVLPLNANENAKINPEPEEMWSLGERERGRERKSSGWYL